MKQHEYTVRCDKDVFESREPHYVIEVSTNNYECYQELKEGIFDVISDYEEEEAEGKDSDAN